MTAAYQPAEQLRKAKAMSAWKTTCSSKPYLQDQEVLKDGRPGDPGQVGDDGGGIRATSLGEAGANCMLETEPPESDAELLQAAAAAEVAGWSG